MYKKHYSRFLNSLGEQLHFAAHSHHLWPDVTRDAQIQYWDDAARFIDDKWEYFFSTIIPETQKKIARLLQLKNEQQIAFAPNTHEFVLRLLSTFELDRPIKILTSQNEFHSFRRQIQRMEEARQVSVTRVQADQLALDRKKFLEDLKQKIATQNYDLVFLSQVFFDSGLAITTKEIKEWVLNAPSHTLFCIDGYHAFAAIPVDLSELEGRIFYLGGGYKYAQAGEGVCFMVIPEGSWRPINTGWFAEMESLSGVKDSKVTYARGGGAFLGSTQDCSAFYRFNSVWNLFEKEGITISEIHEHVKKLQKLFLSELPSSALAQYPLINNQLTEIGHFLTFELKSPDHCAKVSAELKKNGVLTDFRGQRLRIGFGMYQNEEDVLKLFLKCNVVTAIHN